MSPRWVQAIYAKKGTLPFFGKGERPLFRPVRCHERSSMQTNLVLEDGEDIPAILTLPKANAPVAGALLLHGFSSRKEQMADSVGRALERRGIASIAIDLPLHGAREQGVEGLSLRSPLGLVQKWRLAI